MTGAPPAAVAGRSNSGLRSVLWQAMGSAATLASALWVSWHMGLSAQGEFGLAKSWFDAAAAAAALGLPQGLLHLLYRLQVPATVLWPWLTRCTLALGALSWPLAALCLWQGMGLAAAALASIPFAVPHLLARSLLLAERGAVVFGAVTALPALLTLVGVLVYGLAGLRTGFEILLLATCVLAAVASVGLSWPRERGSSSAEWPRHELWTVSLQSWMQGALGALLAAALLSTVVWSGQGGAPLGAASLALHLYQLFAVGAGFVAPLLFDRLARAESPTAPRWPTAARRAATTLFGLALAALWLGLSQPRWAPWLLPVALMIPAGLAAIAARMVGTVLLARGAYRELSVQALTRLIGAVALVALGLRVLPAAAAVALTLLVVEGLTWWRCAVLARST